MACSSPSAGDHTQRLDADVGTDASPFEPGGNDDAGLTDPIDETATDGHREPTEEDGADLPNDPDVPQDPPDSSHDADQAHRTDEVTGDDVGDRIDSETDGDDPATDVDVGPWLALGEPCPSAGACLSGLCEQTTDSSVAVCTASCGSASDCLETAGDGGEWSCLTVAGSPRCVATCKTHACASGSVCRESGALFVCTSFSSPCDGQADCGVGEVCRYSGVDTPLSAYCHRRESGEQGDLCVPGAESTCGSGACWPEAVCPGPCRSDRDCGHEAVCSSQPSWLAGLDDVSPDDWLALCRPFRGSRASCTTDSACGDGEICAADRASDGTFQTSCRLPDPTLGQLGAACADDPLTLDLVEAPRPCQSGICAGQRCTTPCARATDCGDGNWQCLDVRIRDGFGAAGTSRVCVAGAACGTDSACRATEYCALIAGMAGATHGTCRAAAGRPSAGDQCSREGVLRSPAPCTEDADCQHGLVCDVARDTCVAAERDHCPRGQHSCRWDDTCGDVCDDDEDCQPDALCARATVHAIDEGNPDAGDEVVGEFGYCEYVPGSHTTCLADRQCQVEEVCRLVADGPMTFRTVCGRPIPGGVAAGEPCGELADGVVECANGSCSTMFSGLSGSGTCLALCRNDTDCAPDGACLRLPAMSTGICV